MVLDGPSTLEGTSTRLTKKAYKLLGTKEPVSTTERGEPTSKYLPTGKVDKEKQMNQFMKTIDQYNETAINKLERDLNTTYSINEGIFAFRNSQMQKKFLKRRFKKMFLDLF